MSAAHAACVLATLAACGSRNDLGGNRDGGFDAYVRPDAVSGVGSTDRDAGPPRCVGTPPLCGTLPEDRCTTVMGCASNRCRGFPIECHRRTMEECTHGCAWDGAACTGRPIDCRGLSDETCSDQVGCALSPFPACGGVATPCEVRPLAGCREQLGCTANGCMPREGVAAIDLRVVTGRLRRVPLDEVHVRAEAPCTGAVVETVTDSSGLASIELDRAMGVWDLTVAKEDYNVVSILEASELDAVGEIYLERDGAGSLRFGVAGRVLGEIADGHTILVSATSAGSEVTLAATGSWTLSFAWIPELAGTPIDIVALELDETGRAVNAASTSRLMVGTDIHDVELTFPDPPAEAVEVGYRVDLNGAEFDPELPAPRVRQAPFGDFGRSGVRSGSASIVRDERGARVTVRMFPSVIRSDYVMHLAAFAGGGWLEFVQHDLVRPETLVIPWGPLLFLGGESGAVEEAVLYTEGPRAPEEVVVLELSTPDALAPAWRVFAPSVPRRVPVPDLPSAVPLRSIAWHPADPFEAGGRGDDAYAYFVRMRTGVRPWSSPYTAPSRDLADDIRLDWVYAASVAYVGFHEEP